MPALSSRLQANEAEVAAKVMDGEAIMINLSNGMYYSMDQVGGLVWERIAEGRSFPEIVQAVVRAYDVTADRATEDLERLVAELLSEKLVFEHTAPSAAPPPTPAAPGSRLPYQPPLLNKFSDMGDLLALDPPMPGLQDMPWKETSEEPVR